MYCYEEARIALQEIQRVGVTLGEACRRLSEAGAEVVGTSCFHGPSTIAPILEDVAAATPDAVKCAMPVAYRTGHDHPTMSNLPDPHNTAELPYDRTFPDALEAQLTNRYEGRDFARLAKEKGFQVIGVCCGGSVIHHRAVAEALGRQPYPSKYSPDMSKHFMYGDDPSLREHNSGFGDEA